MTEKRRRPSPGYFGQLESCKLPRLKRLKQKREILDDEYFVEMLLAKRKKGDETQYLVKWQDWKIEDSTWEPVKHLPSSPVDEFEYPCPAKNRVEEARERIALVLERGLKMPLLYSEVIEIKHDVVRSLFPSLPSVISKKPYPATENELVNAGLGEYLDRTVTRTGGRRRVDFPVNLRLIIGFSPKFLPGNDCSAWTRRPVQKLQVSFFKEHL